MRRILQPKYLIFFVWMLIIPALISFFGGWDTNVDYLFFLKAFAIALLSTVVYFLIDRRMSR